MVIALLLALALQTAPVDPEEVYDYEDAVQETADTYDADDAEELEDRRQRLEDAREEGDEESEEEILEEDFSLDEPEESS